MTLSSTNDPAGRSSFFPEGGIQRLVLLLFIFAAALSIRLYSLDVPPFDFHPTRQYRSFLLARVYYEESLDDMPESYKNISRAAKPFYLEPPIEYYMVSLLYRVYGGENMMIPRLMSILYWTIGGLLLYLLAKELVSSDGAIIALAIFLFLPYGVRASRSFQPDPLMIMMFIASIYAVFRYYAAPSGSRLAVACVLSGIAILVKPLCLFPIFAAFFAIRIPTRDIRKILFKKDLYIFLAASVLPAILYYGYAIFIAAFMKEQADSSFVPSLLIDPSYWKDWYHLMMSVEGKWIIVFSIAGLFFIRSPEKTALMLGLWAGYFVFGIVFTYHIHTHDYYHLMLMPISALSISFAASRLLGGMNITKPIWRIAFWCLLVFAVLLSVRESMDWLGDKGYAARIKKYREIGEKVHHNRNSLILDGDYGNGLEYYGRVAFMDGWGWPTGAESELEDKGGISNYNAVEFLNQRITEISPEYFIIADPLLLQYQKGLKEELDSKYTLIASTPDYIIYDLRRKHN
jgi:4-amino-4-deoxy-L-arabinose transferase-like glycosyltransferase